MNNNYYACTVMIIIFLSQNGCLFVCCVCLSTPIARQMNLHVYIIIIILGLGKSFECLNIRSYPAHSKLNFSLVNYFRIAISTSRMPLNQSWNIYFSKMCVGDMLVSHTHHTFGI